jgi:hypothetical protein
MMQFEVDEGAICRLVVVTAGSTEVGELRFEANEANRGVERWRRWKKGLKPF